MNGPQLTEAEKVEAARKSITDAVSIFKKYGGTEQEFILCCKLAWLLHAFDTVPAPAPVAVKIGDPNVN